MKPKHCLQREKGRENDTTKSDPLHRSKEGERANDKLAETRGAKSEYDEGRTKETRKKT